MYFSPLTANVYFPAITTIADAFHVSVQNINLTVTVYMIFQGISASNPIDSCHIVYLHLPIENISSYILGYNSGPLRTKTIVHTLPFYLAFNLHRTRAHPNVRILVSSTTQMHTSSRFSEYGRSRHVSHSHISLDNTI